MLKRLLISIILMGIMCVPTVTCTAQKVSVPIAEKFYMARVPTATDTYFIMGDENRLVASGMIRENIHIKIVDGVLQVDIGSYREDAHLVIYYTLRTTMQHTEIIEPIQIQRI